MDRKKEYGNPDERPVKINPNGKYNLDFIDWTNEHQNIYNNYNFQENGDGDEQECPIFGMSIQTFKRIIAEEFQRYQMDDDGFVEIGGDSERLSDDIVKKLKKMKIGKTSKSCSICTNQFKKGEFIRQLPCEHMFHEECIFPWFDKKSNCPNCRFDIKQHYQGKQGDQNQDQQQQQQKEQE